MLMLHRDAEIQQNDRKDRCLIRAAEPLDARKRVFTSI